ncbi:MAG: nitrilase family protein [Bacteroidales bacterium]|nr:nitrilase family protein [Bacteroidales bacterium]
MNELRVSTIQSNIFWEDKEKNLSHFYSLISPLKGHSDLVVLPETFTTGFSMNASHLAEDIHGETIQTLKKWSEGLSLALTGSFIAKEEDDLLYNKGFFITPDGNTSFYNKKHLFRMGEENNVFTPGLTYSVFSYKNWNLRLIICYDLRFPVWNRNKNNEYDLLICTANWPKARAKVWSALLEARAIENIAYVCGVNRIGEDGNKIAHQGGSTVIDYRGNILSQSEINQEVVSTVAINKDRLEDFRKKFPVWKDADAFELL